MITLFHDGFVRLVDHMGSDLSIVRAARVSHDAAERAGQDEGSDYRLINYLMGHNHSTPFESVTFTFEVKAPIFIFRQWHRHRTQSYNEVSARYTELPEEFYIPEPHAIGLQDPKTKQARDMSIAGEELAIRLYRENLREHCEMGFRLYKQALENRIPRELARLYLSVNTYSHMFTTMNLHNLFHFLRLRLDKHAQFEIRVYAEAMVQLITPIVPVATEAFLRRLTP